MEASFFILVIKRLPLLIAIFIIIALLSMVGLNFIPPQYQSTARIIIKGNITDVARIDNNSAANISMVLVRNQLEMLRSTTLFSVALRQIGLDSNPNSKTFKRLYPSLRIKQLPSSTVLQIQLKGKSARTVAEITNTLVECLMEENRNHRKEEVQQVISYLTEKLRETNDELATLEYKNKNVSSQLKPLNSSAFYDASRKLSLYQMEFNSFKKRIPVTDWNRASYIYSDNCIFVKNYQQAIKKHVASLAVLMANSKSNAIKIKNTQTEIWREKVKTSNQILNSIAQNQLKSGDWEQLTYTFLRVIEMKELQNKLKEATPKSLPIVVAADDKKIDSLDEIEEVLINALTDLKVNEGLINYEIEWLDKAIVSDEPYFPTMPLSIIISILLGFGVCIVVIYIDFMWENCRN